MQWGRFLLFFVLIPLIFVSCSGAESSTVEPELVETETAQLPTIVPSPTARSESEQLSELEQLNEGELANTEEPATAEPTAPIMEEPTAVPTDVPTPTLEPTPNPYIINGMSAEQFIIMDDETRKNVREIFAKGQSLGRNPEIFAILGDSLIATPQSLAKWDGDDYVLGEYEFLQPTIQQYQGSFGRYGVSVRVGLHSWSVFDPLWADKDFCLANEDLLTCELRLNNPSVMIIFLGSNDAGSPGGFNVNYRQIVETLIDRGVVPILATKADRFEGPDNTNNEMIRRIATEFQVPLLEFDILADTLPGRGLSSDNVHLTYLEPLDYTNPDIFTMGYPVHNLASLMILDAVRREIIE